MALIGDEPSHVFAVQHGGVVPTTGRVDLQKRTELGCCPPNPVEDSAGAWAPGRSHQPGQVIPHQVTQPALRDAGQIEMAGALIEPHPEVVGLDEPLVLRLRRGVVDQPQFVQDLLRDRTGEVRGSALAERERDQ